MADSPTASEPWPALSGAPGPRPRRREFAGLGILVDHAVSERERPGLERADPGVVGHLAGHDAKRLLHGHRNLTLGGDADETMGFDALSVGERHRGRSRDVAELGDLARTRNRRGTGVLDDDDLVVAEDLQHLEAAAPVKEPRTAV